MRRLIKVILTVIVSLLLVFFSTGSYLKYTVTHDISDETFADIVSKINSAPAVPDTFKKTYARVYPDIFRDNFSIDALKSFFGLKQGHRPSRQVAGWYRHLFHDESASIRGKLKYMGLVLLLEDETSQEKCFEYFVSRFEFTGNVIGIDRASQFYYHKSADSLSLDEQLGLILKLRNPSYFNSEHFPDRCIEAVKRLRERITKHHSS